MPHTTTANRVKQSGSRPPRVSRERCVYSHASGARSVPPSSVSLTAPSLSPGTSLRTGGRGRRHRKKVGMSVGVVPADGARGHRARWGGGHGLFGARSGSPCAAGHRRGLGQAVKRRLGHHVRVQEVAEEEGTCCGAR